VGPSKDWRWSGRKSNSGAREKGSATRPEGSSLSTKEAAPGRSREKEIVVSAKKKRERIKERGRTEHAERDTLIHRERRRAN